MNLFNYASNDLEQTTLLNGIEACLDVQFDEVELWPEPRIN